jgi:hypothetical protein
MTTSDIQFIQERLMQLLLLFPTDASSPATGVTSDLTLQESEDETSAEAPLETVTA